MRSLLNKLAFAGVTALLASTVFVLLPAQPAGATPPQYPAPQQTDCDSGSVSTTWAMTGIAVRPHLTAVVIDGESIPVNQIENPAIGGIGAAICAQDANFAKNSGLQFYRRSGSGSSGDLTGAVTPMGHPITVSTRINVAISMGDLSPYFSFTTVFGQVNSWATAGLHSADATVLASFTPVDGVLVDGMDDLGNPSPSEQGCTQQPPNCSPLKSDLDVFSLNMQFKAERGPDTGFNAFAGGYFALQSAVGGFVQPSGSSLDVTIAGPHYKADGTTLNVGSMSAFLPDSFLSSSFGLTAGSVTDTTFAVTRSEGGTSSAAPWTYRVVPGGIAVDVSSITFSSPKYTISAAPRTLPETSRWPAPPFFSTSKRGSNVTAAFAAAPGGQYVVTFTNLLRTSHVTVTSTSGTWKGRFVTKKLGRGVWLVIARQKVPGGYSEPAFKVIRV